MNRTIAAFFDFDRTLLIKDSAEIGFRWAMLHRKVSLPFLIKIGFASILYKKEFLSAERMAALALQFYRGQNIKEFTEGATEYYHEWLKPYISPLMLQKVEEHRQQKHLLVILSASVDYMLKPVAQELGFDHLLCTQIEVGPDGLGTGRAVGPVRVGAQKRVSAEELAKKFQIDLSRSYAYADHHSDLPLLEAVGNPVVIRPSKALRTIALERQWIILDGE